MTNDEWGMTNDEWGMTNDEWGMTNGDWGMTNGEWGMGNDAAAWVHLVAEATQAGGDGLFAFGVEGDGGAD